MDEKLNQLYIEIKEQFGDNSTKLFTILLFLPFMDTKEWKIPDYLRIPELQEYINFLETNKLIKEIFSQKEENVINQS